MSPTAKNALTSRARSSTPVRTTASNALVTRVIFPSKTDRCCRGRRRVLSPGLYSNRTEINSLQSGWSPRSEMAEYSNFRGIPQQRRGLTAIDAITALIVILLVVQIWLLSATLDAFLAGHTETALPGAIVSGLLCAA